MSIEIRHLVVNATVKNDSTIDPFKIEQSFNPDRFKDEIMDACKEMLRQLLQQQQER